MKFQSVCGSVLRQADKARRFKTMHIKHQDDE